MGAVEGGSKYVGIMPIGCLYRPCRAVPQVGSTTYHDLSDIVKVLCKNKKSGVFHTFIIITMRHAVTLAMLCMVTYYLQCLAQGAVHCTPFATASSHM
jgi:hypothetical protein